MAATEIDETLYLIMSTDVTLAAFFTDVLHQIVYGDDQHYEILPRIVFEKISDPTGSQKPEKWQRWGFNITHTDLVTCEAMQNRVVFLFADGYGVKGSVNINNSSIIDRGRTPLWNKEISAFQTRADVRISYL